jgi:hypothetical protein
LFCRQQLEDELEGDEEEEKTKHVDRGQLKLDTEKGDLLSSNSEEEDMHKEHEKVSKRFEKILEDDRKRDEKIMQKEGQKSRR